MSERADVFEASDWSEAQAHARETARGFARSELMPLAPEIDEKERIPRGLWQRLGKHQLLGVPLPAAHGGQGQDLLCAATVLEELAVACASTAWSVAVHTLLGGWMIARHGTDEQKKRLLPDLCSGRKIAAFALTEPEAGSDAAAVRARAVPADGAYKVSGTKLFVTNAHLADVLLVAAGTAPEGGRKGLSLLLVERGAQGLTIGAGERKLGLRGADWGEVRFENVAVPAANRLGPEHGGYPLLREALAAGRLGVAALALGLAEAAFEASVAHASSRR
jgi:alkylation response protein AidB-like acyl-CoA dehydrogenase